MAVKRKGSNTSTGKVNNVVIREVNGQIVTSGIGQRTKPYTNGELKNQNRMALVNQLLAPVNQFIKVGFQQITAGTTSNYRNFAIKINNPGALNLEGADQVIDYSKAIFSMGNMPVIEDIDIQVNDKGLEFNWDPNWTLRGMKDSDRVMLLACCPERGTAYFVLDGEKRSSGKDTLEILHFNEKVILHTYVAFIAADRKSVSTSIYTGQILY